MKKEYGEKMREFIRKFNQKACMIEFSSHAPIFLASIWDLTKYIDIWNKNTFSKYGIKIDLLLFQIPKEKFANNLNSITILENKVHIIKLT